jgi:hypothetical protein
LLSSDKLGGSVLVRLLGVFDGATADYLVVLIEYHSLSRSDSALWLIEYDFHRIRLRIDCGSYFR